MTDAGRKRKRAESETSDLTSLEDDSADDEASPPPKAVPRLPMRPVHRTVSILSLTNRIPGIDGPRLPETIWTLPISYYPSPLVDIPHQTLSLNLLYIRTQYLPTQLSTSPRLKLKLLIEWETGSTLPTLHQTLRVEPDRIDVNLLPKLVLQVGVGVGREGSWSRMNRSISLLWMRRVSAVRSNLRPGPRLS